MKPWYVGSYRAEKPVGDDGHFTGEAAIHTATIYEGNKLVVMLDFGYGSDDMKQIAEKIALLPEVIAELESWHKSAREYLGHDCYDVTIDGGSSCSTAALLNKLKGRIE